MPHNNPPLTAQNVARYARLFLTAITPFVASLNVGAATINWGTPQTISTAATDVETDGVLILAIDAGSGTSGTTTVTGKNNIAVDFQVFDPPGADALSNFETKFGNTASFGGGSSDYGSLVDDGWWHGGDSDDALTAAFSIDTVVLSELLVGQEYVIQYWAQDADRDPTFLTVLDSATNLQLDTNADNAIDYGQFVVGTFTADATTQSFSVSGTLNGGNNYGRAQLNAFQLRNINNAFIGWQIEAENYSGQSGTDLEDTDDTDGGQNVSYISNNNWLRFDNITLGDNALLNFRVARNTGTDASHIEVRTGSQTGTLIAQIDVPETGGWQTWETISIQAAPVTGPQDIYLVFVETSTTNNGSLFNLNWWSKTPMVEAEDYTAAAGQRFETTQDIGGGQNLGWIADGEWIEYTIEPQVAGWHKFDFRVAAENSDGYINLVLGGQSIGTVDVGATGGFQSWETVSTFIQLPTAGTQTLRLEFVVPTDGFNVNWFSYEPSSEPLSIVVGNTEQQKMRYGMDYERLWYWTGGLNGSERDDIARWSAVDTDIDFIRVAMNSGYELTENTFDLSAYTNKIIPMMQEMQQANPNIKFFASPRPLNEAVSGATWQPYPLWVTGATTYTSGDYDFNDIKCAEYIVKYLLLMKSYGFKISFLDVTNEWQSNVGGGRLTQDDMDDIHNYLHVTYMASPWPHPALDPSLLLEPGDIPELVAPSADRYSQGTPWINNLDSGDKEAISIAACHNTRRDGSAKLFADAVIAKFSEPGDTVPEIWNTEMHGWKSTSSENETTSFFYYLEAIRAGFGGINGWLAIGTTNQGHAYILNPSGTPTRNVKYHIFQKLSSTSNYGHALDIIDEPTEGVLANLSNEYDNERNVAAFIKGNLMTVWVINENATSVPLTIAPTGYTIATSTIRKTRWTDPSDVEGFESLIPITSNTSFTTVIPGESVVCFEIVLNTETFANQSYEAEDYSHQWGTGLEDQGSYVNVANISDGDWLRFGSVALKEDSILTFSVARPGGRPDGFIRVREGNAEEGTILGEIDVPETGNWQSYQSIYTQLDVEAGIYNLYIEFVEDAVSPTGAAFVNIDSFTVNDPAATAAPAAPTNLTATANGSTQIDLAWDAVTAATSYKVFRATSEGGTYTVIASGLSTNSTSDDTALIGVPYFYKVRALNGALESTDSNVATATLPLVAPTNLTATANGSTQIDLAWNTVSGATSYKVLRATSPGGSYAQIASGLATTSTYDDTAVIGVTYDYVVRAISGVDESEDSNVANATLPLETPIGLTATNMSSSQIDLNWSSVTGATSYTVKRATVSGGPYTNIASGLGSPSHSDTTGLTQGTRYYYVVFASTSAVNSSESAQVSAVPSNPVSPESIHFGQMSVTPYGRGKRFYFSIMNSELGHTYQAQKREDLSTGLWIDAEDPQFGTGGILDFAIPIPRTETEHYFRVNIIQQ